MLYQTIGIILGGEKIRGIWHRNLWEKTHIGPMALGMRKYSILDLGLRI